MEDEEVWMNEQMSGDETERVQLLDWSEARKTCQPMACRCADTSHLKPQQPQSLSGARNDLFNAKIAACSHILN